MSQYFESPDGFTGSFGWLCGYSADADFMDLAAERFTGQTRGTRAASGRLCLALMLDSGNAQISPVAAPGVMHIAARSGTPPYRLLHAKVALLGYRNKHHAGRWLLRLLVSTGNWTTGTLRDSLDLVWCIDLDSTALAGGDVEVRRGCADIAAAWDMLSWLRGHYDDALFSISTGAVAHSESRMAAQRLEDWIVSAREYERGHTRFIDNRTSSLLAVMMRKLRGEGIKVPRNYLALGSGFYEGGGEGSEEPTVLRKIVSALQEARLLTRHPVADVFVDERACQAVATTAQTMSKNGWTIRPAGQPSEPDRRLHAKFLFSANTRSDSNNCSSPWLYMGSGNLTAPGFTSRMLADGGNLEAGVVIVPEELYWYPAKGVDPACVISNLLPVQFDRQIDAFGDICAGADMAERDLQFAGLPFCYLYWYAADGGGWLRPESSMDTDDTRLEDGIGGVLAQEEGKGAWWPGAMPRQVRACWGDDDHSALLPVIDSFGRVAGGRLEDLDLDAASWELDRFPDAGAEDEPPDNDDLPTPASPAGQSAAAADGVGQYAVRKMMALVEQIAEKQCSLQEVDWQAWCYRLEQVLLQARNNATLVEFSKVSLNPFSPLYLPPFRPAFAETSDTVAGKMYEGVLSRVEQAWGVADLDAMGCGP